MISLVDGNFNTSTDGSLAVKCNEEDDGRRFKIDEDDDD